MLVWKIVNCLSDFLLVQRNIDGKDGLDMAKYKIKGDDVQVLIIIVITSWVVVSFSYPSSNVSPANKFTHI